MIDRFRAHLPMVAVASVYYAALVTVGVASGNSETTYYALLLPGLALVVAVLDRRRPFSRLVLAGLVLWGGLHMAGGLVPATDDRVLYNVWLLPFVRFDHLVHAVGFGFAGLAFLEAVREPDVADPTRSAVLVLFGGLGIGAVNETIEFLITRVREGTNIGGFENTGWDLVANAVGCLAAAMWARSRVPPPAIDADPRVRRS